MRVTLSIPYATATRFALARKAFSHTAAYDGAVSNWLTARGPDGAAVAFPDRYTLQVAKARGLKTIALTGRDGGSVGRAADIHVNVPDQSAARVQEVHRTLLHVMCEVIEEGL